MFKNTFYTICIEYWTITIRYSQKKVLAEKFSSDN